MIIPWVLEVNASSDVLSPAAVSDSLLITCFYFPFTLQGFFCTHQNMHDTQIGGCQDASLESKMPIDAITCIYLISTQWFVWSWISNNFICSCVRVSGIIALMISSTSFGLLPRKISCWSFVSSCSSDALAYASFLSDSEDLSNFFPTNKSLLSSSTWFSPRMVGKTWMSWALTNVLTYLSNILKEEKRMLHFITGINISRLCIIVFVFARLLRSNTDEEALMIIWVRSCSGYPLFFLSVASCLGARKRNFKFGT